MKTFPGWKEESGLLIISDEVRKIYPEALLGLLAIKRLSKTVQYQKLDNYRIKLEEELRKRFSGLKRGNLKNIDPIKYYVNYYKRFKKTYHVLLQLESIIFHDKAIPEISSLVEVMFMAEMKNLLLTAVHDLDTIHLPIKLDVARGDEKYIKLNGEEKIMLPRDMMVSDLEGITSSIIYGPDRRTRITPDTQNVLLVVYAPSGIEESHVLQHLQDIQKYVQLISPESTIDLIQVYSLKL